MKKKSMVEGDMICTMKNGKAKMCTFEKCEKFAECFGVKNGK